MLREVFSVKNGFFQFYIFLLIISIGLFLSFYSDVISSVVPITINLKVPILLTVSIFFLVFELATFLVYTKVLQQNIYYSKCKECGYIIRFEKLATKKKTKPAENFAVECGECLTEMHQHDENYVCTTCGHKIAFTDNDEVICQKNKEHDENIINIPKKLV